MGVAERERISTDELMSLMVFLVAYAKTLFFVDNEKPKVFKAQLF